MMYEDKTKDKRINIRIDEDTYFALKKIVEDDLKTDLSSYCRSLLWISTLHDATVHRIKKNVQSFRKTKDTKTLEYMITIKNEIEFIEKFLTNIKENRKKYDEFISMIERLHETIKKEAQRYFSLYNEMIDYWEKEVGDWYGKVGDKIDI